jgi:hypothetical protein
MKKTCWRTTQYHLQGLPVVTDWNLTTMGHCPGVGVRHPPPSTVEESPPTPCLADVHLVTIPPIHICRFCFLVFIVSRRFVAQVVSFLWIVSFHAEECRVETYESLLLISFKTAPSLNILHLARALMLQY